jgi:hypothetical protein
MFNKDVQIKKSNLPSGWSIEAADFVNKLLNRKPTNRLGFNGPSEVKNHVWLKNVDWQAIIEKRAKAPILPEAKPTNTTKKEEDVSIK